MQNGTELSAFEAYKKSSKTSNKNGVKQKSKLTLKSKKSKKSNGLPEGETIVDNLLQQQKMMVFGNSDFEQAAKKKSKKKKSNGTVDSQDVVDNKKMKRSQSKAQDSPPAKKRKNKQSAHNTVLQKSPTKHDQPNEFLSNLSLVSNKKKKSSGSPNKNRTSEFNVSENGRVESDCELIKVSTKGITKRPIKTQRNSFNSSQGSDMFITPSKLNKKKSVKLDSSRVEMEISVKNKNTTKDEIQQEDTSIIKLDVTDSAVKGKDLFAWVINPIDADDFFKNYWEQRPVHIKRHSPDYYTSLLSVDRIDQMLRNYELHYTTNIDITTYTNGVRETHNPVGRAHPAVVWDYYSNGCSIRLLNPQSFSKKMHSFNALLQEFFGCFVGANVYLTPADSQGFAPHYDDIEAFVLQVAGKKKWKLYSPRESSEILPRYSSGNFKEDDLQEPIMEAVLNPGDMLYFPRGTIHQAHSLPDTHSLHITLSVYQKNSWADLLEKLIPAALKMAIDEVPDFRKGLPLHFSTYLGIVHSESNAPERVKFIETLQTLLTKMISCAPIDAAVDQLCKQFQHDALPPVLNSSEKSCSVFGDGAEMTSNGQVVNHVELELDTKVRLLRRHVLRLVLEDDVVRLYHSIDNSKVYHELEQQYLEIDSDFAPAVEMLIHSYPVFVPIDDFPLEKVDLKIQLATDLWEAGLIVTEEPLNSVE